MNIYKKVEKISFGILGPKEIKKMSCAKIVTPELYDKEGYPVSGGLMDVRLGVIDPGIKCKTCGRKIKDCIGHFGHIKLARPAVHIKYVKIIHDILKGICRECSRILLSEKEIIGYNEIVSEKALSKKEKKKIKESVKKIKKCPHCGAKKHPVKLEKPSTFTENDKKISPTEIRLRFEKIPSEELKLLGLNPDVARPEWMILTILPIPPVTIRPSITLDTGERSEDDLTHKLGDIVRINQRLFENINAGAPEVIVEDLWDLLQYHITTYFDNTVSQVPPARHRSGQALKTITERIKSKEGRFRYNLTGKRVNFAARTVISPDPQIRFNEVGIPKQIAIDLTVPEKVTKWNIQRLKKFVERGPTKYPGSNYVIRPDGKKKKITDETKEQLIEELQPGYVVERHLMNGDISIFNRQPSLHRMSIMSHKIRVIPGKSFRLHPGTCFPYNADFDGDEMNLHIPQTEEARAEAEVLMDVKTQLINPKHGLNVIGCIEDSITGNYILTKYLEYTKEDAISLLLSIGVENNGKFKKFKSKVTGKEVFSALLPKEFSYIGKSKDGTEVIIQKGELTEGIIDDNTIGKEKGTLIRKVKKEYNEDISLDILRKIFKLGIKVLQDQGFSTGISDTDLPEEVKSKIAKILADANTDVSLLIERYNKNQLETIPSKSMEETVETRILQTLNKVRNKIGEIISKNADKTNPIIVMANSGAKGNILNLSMMSACVGQQALRGKRIERGYADRTTSSFKIGELTPKAKGFISKGFKEGLDPIEFFFGAMTGRDSLMDTALRTPKSGYLYRRLANALQDLKVDYDNTVRDANNAIIQFKYGEDGIDVSKTEKGSINIRSIIKEVIKNA